MGTPLRVLIVEDTPADAELMVLRLEEEGFEPVWQVTQTAVEYTAALATSPDIILADWRLPHFSGLAALELLRQRGLDIPFVIVSGSIGEETAVEALRQGACDYVLKDRPARLGQAVRRALADKRLREERQQAEAEKARLLTQVQAQARQIAQIMDTVPEGVLLLDATGRVLLANPTGVRDLERLAGVAVGQLVTHLGDLPLTELLTPDRPGPWREIRADGRIFEVIGRPVVTGQPGAGDRPEHWVLVIRDVTHEREIRQRTFQQERLAAIGQLAAGIAHDFNNILAVIVLQTYLVEKSEPLPAKARERLEIITRQAEQASNLIEQILDFSRRSVMERRPMDLLPFLKEEIKLLKRTLPEHIRITLNHGPETYIVSADPTRLQQAFLNLALNARDAMPSGGRLEFGLDRLVVSGPADAPLPDMAAGTWIRVRVSDTGMGISPTVLPHIFEPFFTTKGPGKGSGLGLSQVHGIVKQHDGEIDVSTQVGVGTTFTIYLPALDSATEIPNAAAELAEASGAGQTILIVEDDLALREALADAVEMFGYRPLSAANGRQALAVLAQNKDVALVLSDLVMPEMGGRALLETMRRQGLGLPVVILSGHPLDDELAELQALGMTDWLLKPPELANLARTLGRAVGPLAPNFGGTGG